MLSIATVCSLSIINVPFLLAVTIVIHPRYPFSAHQLLQSWKLNEISETSFKCDVEDTSTQYASCIERSLHTVN